MEGARAIARRVADRETTATEVAARTLEAIRSSGDPWNALLAVHEEEALRAAAAVDVHLDRGGSPGPLCGVPFARKANFVWNGIETTCASSILAGYRPLTTATAIDRLIAAGAVPVATTNMDEFAMGSSGEHSAQGPTRNPWDPRRVPGGSSSGSAAAVAAGLVPIALGSDTGGSARQPAAHCGVVGAKASRGLLSRRGLVAFASSLDEVGVLAREAADAALVLAVLAGRDGGDATTVDGSAEERALRGVAVDGRQYERGLRVGVPAHLPDGSADADVRRVLRRTTDGLASAGVDVVDLGDGEWLDLERAVSTYQVLACAEAASNLARFTGIHFGPRADRANDAFDLEGAVTRTRSASFGPEVRRRILVGVHALSAGHAEHWYRRAAAERARITGVLRSALAGVDVILVPTTPSPAVPLGSLRDDPVEMYLCDAWTVPASLAGLPAVSVPAGLAGTEGGGRGLPVGVQVVGAPGDEARVLGVARLIEDVRGPLPLPTSSGSRAVAPERGTAPGDDPARAPGSRDASEGAP